MVLKKFMDSSRLLGCAILFVVSFVCNAYGKCYKASDIGLGNDYVFSGNPIDDSISLLRVTPLSNQVAPWIDTGLVVDPNATNLTIQVSGSWAPWGDASSNNPVCTVRACDPNKDGVECVASPAGEKVISENGGVFTACNIDVGVGNGSYGLYGLIAIADDTNNYVPQDPNSPSYWDFLPSSSFRTFHVSPFISDAIGGNYFTLTHTSTCNLPLAMSGTNATCVSDPGLRKGKLYMKIVDTYYGDNTGAYTVHFASGIAEPKGFIQSSIEAFEHSISSYSLIIYSAIQNNSGYFLMVKSMIVFYVAISAVLLSIGMLNVHVSEFVKILFKMGVILTMLSDTSLSFFQQYLFSFIVDSFDEMALVVLNAAQQQFTVPFSVSSGNSPLAVYDTIVKMLTSKVLNMKILSLIFYKYWVFLVPVIYLSLFLMLMAIVNALLIYIVGIVNIALLIAIFPFFIVMILFQITRPLFDSWMRYFISNAMVGLFLYSTIALMIALIFNSLEGMLSFEVCERNIAAAYLGSNTIFNIQFWMPSDGHGAASALTLGNLGNLVVISMFFNKIIGEVPSVAETISNAQSDVGGSSKLKQFAGSVAGFANAVNPIALILKGIDSSASSMKMTGDVRADAARVIVRAPVSAVRNAWVGVQHVNTAMSRLGSITEGAFGDGDYGKLKNAVEKEKKDLTQLKP